MNKLKIGRHILCRPFLNITPEDRRRNDNMSLEKLYLELTNKCNLNCEICYRNSWNEELVHMDSKLYQKIKREIREISSLKSIVLGGIGEPSYAPLIKKALQEFGNYDLIMTTNAVDFDQQLLNLIVENVNLLIISIDGLYKNYEKIRGADLDAVINNITKINSLRKENKNSELIPGIQYVISKNNIDDIFNIIDLADQLNIQHLVLSNLLPQNIDDAEKILYTRYENKEVKGLFNKANNYSFRKGIKLVLPNYELKTERRCNFIENEATFITASGEVVPCYRLSHQYKEYVFSREKTVLKHSFGSLKESSLINIWESQQYKDFRKMIRNNRYPSCIDCDYVEGCDLVKDTSCDCNTGSPSCADCLWARKYILCP